MRITILGCGNMGGAIAKALSENKSYRVSILSRTQEKALAFAQGKNITVLNSLSDMKESDVIILAVKPQVLPSLYEDLKTLKPSLFISIAAGISLETLRKNLGTDNVVRFMPNIAAKEKASVTAVSFKDLKQDLVGLAMEIASSFGSAFILDEKLLSAFIGISGSAIAYMLEFMHQIAMGGVLEGIAYQQSLQIVRETMRSAVTLQGASNENPIELETRVCSAGGTTIEGIKALADNSFASACIASVRASAQKNRLFEGE